jgi:hypothetical protein
MDNFEPHGMIDQMRGVLVAVGSEAVKQKLLNERQIGCPINPFGQRGLLVDADAPLY